MNQTGMGGDKEAEQIDIARQVGGELTEAFVSFVRGRIGFDELSFGVYDALSDLHAVASGDYELVHDDDHDHEGHEHGHDYDEREATEEQEDLAQEPSRDASRD